MEKNSNTTQTEDQTKKSGLRKYLLSPVGIATSTIIIAATFCIIISSALTAEPSKKVSNEDIKATNQTVNQYEVISRDVLDNLIKEADAILIKTLKSKGVKMSEITIQDVSLKKDNGQDFHYQKINFTYPNDKAQLSELINQNFSQNALNATSKISHNQLQVSINGVQTHLFSIITPVAAKPVKSKPLSKLPKLAIVIDDIGESMTVAKGLATLSDPVTLSIWPDSSHARKAVAIAKKYNREIMIHLPMQPKGYPKVNPGPNALLVTMNADQIKKIVSRAMKFIPEATGLNNHMGSKFTEFRTGMKVVMKELKKGDLFFLDSKTTAKSVGVSTAKKAHVTVYKRNIFIDNVQDVSAIKYQLDKAARIAIKTGQAIAIGHPHPKTLQAVKAWIKQNKNRVKLVKVKELTPQ